MNGRVIIMFEFTMTPEQKALGMRLGSLPNLYLVSTFWIWMLIKLSIQEYLRGMRQKEFNRP